MMRRWIWVGVGVVALGGFGYGLFKVRPDLLGLLSRWTAIGKFGSQGAEPEAGTTKPEPVELVADGWCLAHSRPEASCADCASSTEKHKACVERLPLIRLASPGVARIVQIETADVSSQPHTDTLAGNAEVAYNGNAYAEVRPRVSGLVRTIETDEGHVHKKGDILATIDSAEVGTAKAQYLSALPLVKLAQATLQRTQELTRANALPLKDELEASTVFNRARADLLNSAQKLRNLGFKDADLAEIEKNNDTTSLLRIVSPIDGTIVSRHAVTGEAIDPLHQLFVVADIRMMWIWIDVYEADIDRVKADEKVTLRIGGMKGLAFPGRVDWIDTAVNPATRTIRVRAEIQNPDGRLRSNEFGSAEIVVGQPHQAILVPKQSVQTIGSFDVVFLPQADGSYRPQRVLLEEESEVAPGLVEIVWGVQPGQKVVTTGAFVLKSELIKKMEAVPQSGETPPGGAQTQRHFDDETSRLVQLPNIN